MAPAGVGGPLGSLNEAPWSRGLWHGFEGLPALIQAARAALAAADGPVSLCLVEVAHRPVSAGDTGSAREDDRMLVEAVAYLRDRMAETAGTPGAGSLFRLRDREFGLLLPGLDMDGRRRLQERIHAAGHPGRDGSGWFRCGGATYPDDGTALSELWLAADSRRLTALAPGGNTAGELDWRASLSRWPERCLTLMSTFLERVEGSVRLSEHLALLAYTDPLTGLPNQRAVTDLLQLWMGSGEAFSLLLIDGDGLKAYNQRFGYEGGNLMIRNVSRALAGALPDGTVLARWLSGDEFVVLLRHGEGAETAAQLCQRIRREFKDWPIPVTVSVGVARFPDHGRDPDSLIRAASRATDEAKRRGKDRVVVARTARRRA